MSYKLQVISYKLQVTSYKLQARSRRRCRGRAPTSYKLQATSYKLQVTSYKLQSDRLARHLARLGVVRDGEAREGPASEQLEVRSDKTRLQTR